MNTWKKRLKKELDGIVPELGEDVKNAPIPVSEQINYNGGRTAVLSRKTVIPIVAVAAACLIALVALIVCLALPTPKKQNGMLFFTVEINPSISLAADANGTVTNVIASNADADVILSADGVKQNMVDKNIADAAAYYADCAARLGYIDLESECSAVRVSGYGSGGSEELLGKTKGALEEYFLQKGVFAVVIAEAVDKTRFAERSGIPEGSDETMASFMTENKTLFSYREAGALELNELQELYANNKNLKELITDELSRNLDKLTKNAEDVRNLISLYFRIFEHEDNPASALLKGYWEVKKFYGDKIDGEFAELVAEMDGALQAYKDDYGVEITSFYQLQAVANDYMSVSVELIGELIENFTYEVFGELSSALSEILTAAGVATDEFLELTKLPQTVEEYFDKTAQLLRAEYDERIKQYENAYAAPREPITKTDYDGFLDSIVDRYGSLENYWQSVKD